MRISDWSSDVCSSDLITRLPDDDREDPGPALRLGEAAVLPGLLGPLDLEGVVGGAHHARHLDRDGALADRLERIVGAGERIEHLRRAVGDRKSTRLNSSR